MSPRSSMLTSRFTRTLCAANRCAPVARLVDTTAGSSCGVIPTAIASEKSTASISGRPRATLITRIARLRTPATFARSPENFVRPTWNSVGGWRSPRPSAIAPNRVSPPVATTTACAEPRCTTVPMNRAGDGPSFGEALAAGSGALSTGRDSPVRIDSSHSRPRAVRTRRSAGTMAPMPSDTTSPGTRCVASTSTVSPSRSVATSWRIWEWSASAARSARNSFAVPSPTEAATITAMISASAPWPTSADTRAAANNRSRSGDRNWVKNVRQMLAWCVRTALGPVCASRASASAPVRPVADVPSAVRTSVAGIDAAASSDGRSDMACRVAMLVADGGRERAGPEGPGPVPQRHPRKEVGPRTPRLRPVRPGRSSRGR